MKEILRERDMFKLNLIKQLLESNGIEAAIFDQHMGSLWSAQIPFGARLMVTDEDVAAALEILSDAEKNVTDENSS